MRITLIPLLLLIFSGHTLASEYKLPQPTLNDNLNYTTSRINVLDSTISYIDEGKGQPVLLIHGNPTSSYLWRNVIPYIAKHNRAVAIDLIGMGQSGKPNIPYSYQDQCHYLSVFIDKNEFVDGTSLVVDRGHRLI